MRIKRTVLLAFLLGLYIAPVIFMSSYASPTIPAQQKIGKEFHLSYDNWYADTSFQYRRLFDTNGTNDYGVGDPDSINYAINITVPYNANMQADFDDIRFTSADGITDISYWRESYISSTSADFWVVLPDAADDFTLFMYYGNSTVSTTSSGTNTFPFFDDFENNNMNRWYDAGAYWSTVSDRVKHGSYAGFGDAGAVLDGRYLSQNLTSFSSKDIMLHMFAQTEVQTAKQILSRSYNTSAGTLEALNMDSTQFYYDNGPYTPWSATTYSADTWYELEIALDYTNSLYRFWRDGVSVGAQDFEDTIGSAITSVDSWDFIVDSTAGNDVWLDDCYVRKWTLNEPFFDSWGVIQNVNDVVEWKEIDAVTLIFWVDFDYWAMDVSLILLGLFLVVISACWLAYKLRSGSMDRDSGYLFLLVFMLAWGLVLGGAML